MPFFHRREGISREAVTKILVEMADLPKLPKSDKAAAEQMFCQEMADLPKSDKAAAEHIREMPQWVNEDHKKSRAH